MKIIVTEEQVKKVLGGPDIIEEQSEMLDDQKTLIILQNKINDLINKKEKEILDKSGITVSAKNGTVLLKIGEQTYTMEPKIKGVYATVIPPKSKLEFGGPPMGSLMEEIQKIPEYKALVEKHPEIQKQAESMGIRGILYTDPQNQGTLTFTHIRALKNMKDSKFAVPLGTEYPLGEFLERNKVIYSFSNGTFGILESGGLTSNLIAAKFNFNPVKTTTGQTVATPAIIKPIVLGDVFNFDGVDFKDENVAQQQYATFIQQMKENIQKYGEPFIKHIQSQNPTIYGYSSVDGDPDQPITGGYQPCSGNKTRKDYDKCLSTERAKKIADILNNNLKELGGAFKGVGMGETTKWGPGWTKENPTIPQQTAPNRRYVLSNIKPFQG